MSNNARFGICYNPTWAGWSPPYSNTGPQAQFSDADFFNDSFQALWNTGSDSSGNAYRNDLSIIGGGNFDLLRLYNWGSTRGWNGTTGTDHLSFLDHASTCGLQVVVPISNYFLSDDTYAWNRANPPGDYSFSGAPSAIQTALQQFLGSVTDPSTGQIHAAVHSFSVGNEIDINTLAGQGSGGVVDPASRLARVIWWLTNLQGQITAMNLGEVLLTSPISNADQGNPGTSTPSYWFGAFVDGVTITTPLPQGTTGGSGNFASAWRGLLDTSWYYNSVNIYQIGPGLAATLGQYDAWQKNAANNLNWPGQQFKVGLLLTEIGVERGTPTNSSTQQEQFTAVTENIATTIQTYLANTPGTLLMGYCIYEFSDEPYLNANWGMLTSGTVNYQAATGTTQVSYGSWPTTDYPVEKLTGVENTSGQTLISALSALFAPPVSITTNGWDTVFATSYTNINRQITSQWPSLVNASPTLGTIDAALPNGKASVKLQMGPWQLTQGGSGQNVRLKLPVVSGTMSGIDGNYDLANQSIVLELGLQWVPQSNQVNFAISQNLSAIEADLGGKTTVTPNIIQAFSAGGITLAADSTITVITADDCWKVSDPSSGKSYYLYVTNTKGALTLIEVYQFVSNELLVHALGSISPVTVISAGNITDEIDGPLFMELVSQNIDENLKEFNFVFATTDVVTQLSSNDAWAWLKPTTVEYAVAEPLSATDDNCVFAVLAMVDNNTNSDPVLQADANAIPTGSDCALLISPAIFLSNMLAPGAQAIFQGSQPSDFKVDTHGLTITNTTALTWGNFKLDNGDQVTLSVGSGDFNLSLNNDRIGVSFTNLSYPVTLLGANVGTTNIVFTGHFSLELQRGTNGNRTLWFDIPADQPAVTDVSTTMSSAFYTAEEVLGYLSIALLVVGIGVRAVPALAGRAVRGALIAGGELDANVGPAGIRAALRNLLNNPEARQDFAARAGAAALATIDRSAVLLRQTTLWSSIAKCATGLSLATGAAAGGLLEVQATLTKAQANDWNDTPSFTDFAGMAVEQYSLAGLSDYAVQSAGLAQCLQIGFATRAG